MNLTNRMGLPDGLVQAIKNDSYSKGDSDFTVTELLKPPRQRALIKRHEHEITEDASDRIWSLLGQATHVICERGNVSDIAEKRFFADFDGVRLSAQIDTLGVQSRILSDYKVTTQYKAKPGPADPDFTAQLNMQAEILRMNGHEVDELRIIAILRDWSKLKAKVDPDLPQSNVVVLQIPMWTREQTQSFIKMRIALHQAAEKALPRCTPEETWAKSDIYAVMKGARAIPGGLQNTESAAQALLAKTPGARIEFRPGEKTRCASYCSAAPFCAQFKNENKSDQEVSSAI